MRSLELALSEHELITLRVIGEWWELDLTGVDKSGAVVALLQTLSRVDIQQEMLFLPPEEEAAMRDLISHGGRAPVAVFSRDHGDVRMMGPGRMEREEPWLDPISATEALWYRGFIYRAFDETAEDLLEFYFIPKEFLAELPQDENVRAKEPDTTLDPVKNEPTQIAPAPTTSVDDLTTLLAVALTMAHNPDFEPALRDLLLDPDVERRSLLLSLANEMGLLQRKEGTLRPTRAAVDWLKKPRLEQLLDLADAWSNSDWNDLCHTPGLRCEGDNWHNDPILARTALLEALPRTSAWYSMATFIDFIKNSNPDFQRPDGNYEVWYIKDAYHDGYLAGFESWDEVEGRLLAFLLQGPLHWLGMIDTANTAQPELTVFRLNDRALAWLDAQVPHIKEEQVPVIVQPDGTILVPREGNRYLRFQVARIAESQPLKKSQAYLYRLTPGSLSLAQDQGIANERIVQFLEKASGKELPKSVKRALARLQERGIEARLQTVTVLRVTDATIIETLRANPRTRDYLGESLGELAVEVKPGKWRAFCEETTALGLLLDAAGVESNE